MKSEEFLVKWRHDVTGEWAKYPYMLYWARSYNMLPSELLEMSIDLMSFNADFEGFNSSITLARRTIGNAMMKP